MTFTRLLGLLKPDRTDSITVSRDIGQNMDMIDDAYEMMEGFVAIPENGDLITHHLRTNDIVIRNNELYFIKAEAFINTSWDDVNKEKYESFSGALNWIGFPFIRTPVDSPTGRNRSVAVPVGNNNATHIIVTAGLQSADFSMTLVFSGGENDNPVIVPVLSSSNISVSNHQTNKGVVIVSGNASADTNVYISAYRIGVYG